MVGEQKLSRWRASWLLVKESWRFLRADSELLLVPVIATIMMVLLFGILMVTLLVTGMIDALQNDSALAVQGTIFIFGSYLITAFVVALSRAMVVHTVAKRAENHDATLRQSFGVALRHAPALFIWALISATVGMVLRTITERFDRLGRFITAFLGAAWGVLTYFVVPAIVLDNKPAIQAVKHSGTVFKQTWGESLITNISLGLIFSMLHMLAALMFFAAFMISTKVSMPVIFILAGVMYIIFLFGAIAVQQVLESIIVTLLYVYATTKIPPANFNPELLEAIVVRTGNVTDTTILPLASTV
ncbi:MAG: hypothetical protein RLZZ360_716 [Candidatus Parcubacteria bacterium]